MKTFATKIAKISSVVALSVAVFIGVQAADDTDLQIQVNDGALNVDIVDTTTTTGSGTYSYPSVADPLVPMSAVSFSFITETSTGTLGTTSEAVLAQNPTASPNWTVSIGATDGLGALWSDGGTNTFDFNDADSNNGQLTIDPSSGTVAAEYDSGVTTGVSVGSIHTYNGDNSMTLFSADGTADNYSQYSLIGVDVEQTVPGETPAATYTINLTLTIV